MKATFVSLAAIAGFAAAQDAYSAPASTTTFACNPAHSYPNGAECISTAGSLTLVTPSATASATFACNPAHSYPNGAECTSVGGSLTLVTPSATASPTYACNPAHSYPNGASCISTAGTLSLVTPHASSNATATGAVYTTAVVTAFTTYCPLATTLTYGQSTYTVSKATTLTITNCPGGCTITTPVASAPAPTKPATVTTSGVAKPSTGGIYPSTTSLVPYTGAAEKVKAAGAMVGAAVGAAALFL